MGRIVISFRKPTAKQVREALQQHLEDAHSYSEVGATCQGGALSGYQKDRSRILLGSGEEVFLAGCEMLRRWRMFPDAWTEAITSSEQPEVGAMVGLVARGGGLWWLNLCRVVYCIDDSSPNRRFGFAYGTLPNHVELGEERFMVEWDDQDQVWYEIFSFSRPRHWLARLVYPLTRQYQRRFVRDSLKQMQQAVAAHLKPERPPNNVGRNNKVEETELLHNQQ